MHGHFAVTMQRRQHHDALHGDPRRTVFHARVELCPSFSTAGRVVCQFNIRGTAFLWHQVWVFDMSRAPVHLKCART